MTDENVKKIADQSRDLIQPSLVAIYLENSDGKPDQIGTGFVILHNERPLIVTAKHVLFGHDYDEDPTEKLIFMNGKLVHISESGINEICKAEEHDLCIFYADNMEISKCLTEYSLHSKQCEPLKVLTIHGYLSRDFRRSEGVLRPAPKLYTDKVVEYEEGYVAICYPKNKAKNTDSGERVKTAIPRGMSGCPILNSVELYKGNIEIAGVFTDHVSEKGISYGEHADKLRAMMHKHMK